MGKRAYTKKNTEYWENLGNRRRENLEQTVTQPPLQQDFEPSLVGDPLISFEAKASSSRLTTPTSRTSSRTNRIAKGKIADRFANIDEGLLPFEFSEKTVNLTEAIKLCQKAYFNIPVFKSTIDLLSEFADTDIYLEGGSVACRKFIKAFFKKINIDNLKEQFFREYYRSSNVFMYRLDSRLLPETLKDFKLKKSALLSKIPVKYVILNPTDIVVNGQLSFGEHQYAKALTPFEIERLRDEKNPEGRRIYEALTKEVKDQLKKTNSTINTGEQILLELKPEDFHVVFYKKQDYEPLAVPFGYAVLDDINKKLELKKIDQAIARSVENVILLVTMGNEPDKGGINHNNLAAMQQIFENKSVGRVLVSDYTTQAQFILPDLTLIMGEQKYEVLNRDIQEGLGNLLTGESKYSDTELKLKLFFQRLEAGKEQFLREFLQPEVDRLCKEFGFRKVPEIHLKKEDVINSEKLQKLVTRMMELGVLTPEQGIDTIHKGEFPAVETMREAQLQLREEKLEGLYAPLVSSQNFFDPMTENEAVQNARQMEREGVPNPQIKKEPPEPSGRPSDQGGRGGNTKDRNKGGSRRAGTYVDRIGRRRRYPDRRTPTVSSPSGGRPVGQAATMFSVSDMMDVVEKIKGFQKRGVELYKASVGSDLNEAQEKVVCDLCMSVIKGYEDLEWEEALANIIDHPKDYLTELHTQGIILEIGEEHQLDDYAASILYHSIPVIEEDETD